MRVPSGLRMQSEAVDSGEFDPLDLSTSRRTLHTGFATTAARSAGGEFFQDEEDVLRSVGMEQPTLKAADGQVYRDLQLPARQQPVFDVHALGPAAFGAKLRTMPDNLAVVNVGLAKAALATSVSPPALPPPPFPLERHAYGLQNLDAGEVCGQISRALAGTLVDAEPIVAECTWDCTVVSSGKHVRFLTRLYQASEQFCLEFQRRKGCSIVFNMAVSGVLKHIAKARRSNGQAPVANFKRSEADCVAAPSKGFVVESFDIPEVPLDLSFEADFPSTATAAKSSSNAERDVSDGVQVLLEMASSGLDDMAIEGAAGLAILSKPEGREALLAASRVHRVAKAADAALESEVPGVQVAGATLLANLTEDQRSHEALVAAGALDKAVELAESKHGAATAHIRRECLRALVHFCGGPQRSAVMAKGAASVAATVPVSCNNDPRMLLSAQRLKQALAQ